MLKQALPFLRDCSDVSGQCKNDIASCDAINTDDVTYTQGLQSCTNNKAICCIPNKPATSTGATTPDTGVKSPECSGKKKGAACATAKVCMADAGLCDTLCNYCNANPDDTQCKSVVLTYNNIAISFQPPNVWTCGCDLNTCKTLSPNGKCIMSPKSKQLFCTADNSQFCCAK
jgi:hypothetical protein